MTTVAELLKQIHKDHGAAVATMGMKGWVDLPRLSTGIFPLDLAMGGGWPQGKCSIIFGPESSNKTNITLLTIAEAQRAFPKKKPVFVDVEHALDLKWATTLGVDPDNLLVLHPETTEQAVDFTESFLYAEDVSLIVLDSIAALTTAREIDNAAEVAAVGGSSLLIGKLYRKAVVSFSKMSNAGVMAPAFLAVNQIRHKIGTGPKQDPETMPGGNPPKFASAMTLRVRGRNIMDPKIHAALPAFKEVTGVIKKWKVPILSINTEFNMQMIKANGHNPGFVSDWNTVSTYMKELDYLAKGEKSGWVMSGENYKTLEECKAYLYGNPDLLAEMKAAIIKEMVDAGPDIEPTGELPLEE